MFFRKEIRSSFAPWDLCVAPAAGAMVAPGLGLTQTRAAGYAERTIMVMILFGDRHHGAVVSTHLGEAIGDSHQRE